VLLCFNPSLVYDVGFQLSYAAVFSIVYFHPFLYGLRYFKFWIADQIWLMLTVSVAAQIGTIPFLLHYFHQFPTWFLLANLMVIPLVSVILYLSFIVFAVAPIIPFLGVLMTRVLDWAGQGMLFSVHFVERLPYSVLEGLYPSDLSMFLVVLFAVLFSIFLVYKIRESLIYALISIIILLIINNINISQQLVQQEVVIFNLTGKTLIAFTSGRETFWLTSDKGNAAGNLKSYIKPYEGFRGIKRSSIICLSDSSISKSKQFAYRQNFVNFKGLSLLVFNNRRAGNKDLEHIPRLDVIIFSGKNQPDLALMYKHIPSALIVENSPLVKENEMDRKMLLASNEQKHFSTSLGGAVQIRFRPTTSGANEIVSCGYFSAQ
jgi:competence protein ComEC